MCYFNCVCPVTNQTRDIRAEWLCVTRSTMEMRALRSPKPADSLCRAPLWESAFYCILSMVKSISLCHSRVMALAHTRLCAPLENISCELCNSRISVLGWALWKFGNESTWGKFFRVPPYILLLRPKQTSSVTIAPKCQVSYRSLEAKLAQFPVLLCFTLFASGCCISCVRKSVHF